jgi:hypothetical protein
MGFLFRSVASGKAWADERPYADSSGGNRLSPESNCRSRRQNRDAGHGRKPGAHFFFDKHALAEPPFIECSIRARYDDRRTVGAIELTSAVPVLMGFSVRIGGYTRGTVSAVFHTLPVPGLLAVAISTRFDDRRSVRAVQLALVEP